MAWDIETDQDGVLKARSKAPPAPTRTRGDVLEGVRFRFATSNQSDYNTMQRYLNYVGHVETMTTADGEPRYRETQSDSKSMLMQFSPTSSVPTIDGWWGVLVEGRVDSPLPPAQLDIVLDIYYLAEDGDYASHSDVRAVFEV